MKVMISKPGISIENINKDSFYALCNNNNSPIGGKSVWNGMMIIGNFLYTCSSDNLIRYSEIPIFEEPNKYNTKLRNEYYIKNGNISINGNKIIVTSENTLIINKYIDTSKNNTFYTYITPNVNNDCGLIFGLNNSKKSFSKKNNYRPLNYFIFVIKKEGYLALYKYIKGIYYEIISNKKGNILKEFNIKNTYKMTVKFDPLNGKIVTYINEDLIFFKYDKSLTGTKVGFKSYGKGTIFTQIINE